MGRFPAAHLLRTGLSDDAALLYYNAIAAVARLAEDAATARGFAAAEGLVPDLISALGLQRPAPDAAAALASLVAADERARPPLVGGIDPIPRLIALLASGGEGAALPSLRALEAFAASGPVWCTMCEFFGGVPAIFRHSGCLERGGDRATALAGLAALAALARGGCEGHVAFHFVAAGGVAATGNLLNRTDSALTLATLSLVACLAASQRASLVAAGLHVTLAPLLFSKDGATLMRAGGVLGDLLVAERPLGEDGEALSAGPVVDEAAVDAVLAVVPLSHVLTLLRRGGGPSG